jgi:predicted TIM-barrel fold metal-dependent hydrolase
VQGTPDEWLRFLDGAGIGQAVLYPSGGLFHGMTVDVDISVAVARAYNDWMSERYMKRSPRLQGVGILPIADVGESVIELRRAVTELHMKAIMLQSNGQALGKHLGAPMWWPLYAEAERLGCVLAIHGGAHHNMGLIDTFSVYYPVPALGHPLGLLTSCAGMVSHGIFDRFPTLKVAFLEGGSCWLPFLMERLDRTFETHSDPPQRREMSGPSIEEKPSDYIRRLVREGRFFVGFDLGEEMLGYAIKRAGREAFLYASDFPHEGFSPDNARREIDEIRHREDLDDEDKRAVLGANARRFYGLNAIPE